MMFEPVIFNNTDAILNFHKFRPHRLSVQPYEIRNHGLDGAPLEAEQETVD